MILKEGKYNYAQLCACTKSVHSTDILINKNLKFLESFLERVRDRQTDRQTERWEEGVRKSVRDYKTGYSMLGFAPTQITAFYK